MNDKPPKWSYIPWSDAPDEPWTFSNTLVGVLVAVGVISVLIALVWLVPIVFHLIFPHQW